MIKAQQYLLTFAKQQWPNVTLNLGTLGELTKDKPFQLALQELEEALYSKNVSTWNGEALLAAFQRIKKDCKERNAANKPSSIKKDTLPPLNPTH